MSDFYTVLRQSIIDRGLSAPEAREEAYAQARRAMVNRLWSYEPPLAEDEIDHRIGQFDIAVARIEDDVAAVFATMEAERGHAADPEDDARPGDDDPADDADADYPPAFGGAPGAIEDEEDGDAPQPAGVPARSLDETSRAVARALERAQPDDDLRDEDSVEDVHVSAHDEDVAGWSEDEPRDDEDDDRDHGEAADEDRALDETGTTAPPRRAVPPVMRPSSGSDRAPVRQAGPSLALRLRRKAGAAMPASEAGQLRLLIGVVAGLAVVLAIGLVWAFLPGGTITRGGPPAVLQTEVPGGVSDHDTAIRLPREAISVTSSFTLFNGQDPTVFAGDPGNPVRFDGEYARIATSAGSPGAKVIIGAGLSSRLAGRVIRVTIDARSARENGATSMRFAYESGVAISHWQTANLAADFTPLGLVWRVPSMRTSPTGDYIVIEPGIPGSGSAVEIRSIRIDLVDQ